MYPCDVNYCNVINVNVFLFDLASISNKLSIFCYENSSFIDFFSWAKDSRKNIYKNNIKWFTRICSLIWCSSVFTKKTCVLTRMCSVLLVFIFPHLVWCWCHIIKQIFHVFFCLISKLSTLGNILFNSASRRWILITLGE